MDINREAVPVTWAELQEYRAEANRRLRRVTWSPRIIAASGVKQPAGADMLEILQRHGVTAGDTVSLVEVARSISQDEVLLNEDINVVMTVIREGLQVASHLVALYGKTSNLVELQRLNSRNRLSAEQQTEFNEKQLVSGAIAAFILARYVRATLGAYKAEEVSAINVDFHGLPEVALQNQAVALDCILYYYGKTLELGAKDGLQFVRLTDLYFRRVIEELGPRVTNLRYAEPFIERSYLLEGGDFGVNGFDASDLDGHYASVEFNGCDLDDIVGNREAKHAVELIAERLVCYDPPSRKNPMFELGALSTVNMLHGVPGTGKSMLIGALAKLIQGHCQRLGLPFLFHPLPGNIVNSYQGKSGEGMENWFAVIRDPSKIILAPIDDAENVLEARTRDHVSAGVREVVTSFLRNTEGPTAVNRGNAMVLIATNIPDQVDPAVMSRVNRRDYIGGAEKREDFLDQMELWRRKYDRITPRLLQLDPPHYEYMSAQKPVAEAGEVLGSVLPKDERLCQVVEATLALHSKDEEAFYAELFVRVQEVFTFFRSRDVRNIQRAIDGRVFDFRLPPEWLNNPEVFHRQSYERKLELINGLIEEHVKNLDPVAVRWQETVLYLDNLIRAVAEGRRRRIEERAEQLAINLEAERLFHELHGSRK